MKRIVLVLVLLAITGCSASPASNQTPKYTASPQLQSQRIDYIKNSISNGVFMKVVPDSQYPQLWVGTSFYLQTFDDKAKIVNPVWAYYASNNANSVVLYLYDGYSGKEIGKFGDIYGGLQLD